MEDEFNQLGISTQPMGLASFAPTQPLGITSFAPTSQPMPDVKDVIGTAITNMAKKKAMDAIGSKLGLPAISNLLGVNTTIGPLGFGFLGPASLGIGALRGLNNQIQTSTFGKSKTFQDYLQAKRTQKAIQREQTRDLQDRINKGDFGGTTSKDDYRGNQYGGNGGSGSNTSTGSSAERGAALHG